MTPDEWFDQHGYEYETARQLVRDVWNAALDEAARLIEQQSGDTPYEDTMLMAEEIRALKAGPQAT